MICSSIDYIYNYPKVHLQAHMAQTMQMQQVVREEMTAIIARVPAQPEESSLAMGVIMFGLTISSGVLLTLGVVS